jgi:hypothetical protein
MPCNVLLDGWVARTELGDVTAVGDVALWQGTTTLECHVFERSGCPARHLRRACGLPLLQTNACLLPPRRNGLHSLCRHPRPGGKSPRCSPSVLCQGTTTLEYLAVRSSIYPVLDLAAPHRSHCSRRLVVAALSSPPSRLLLSLPGLAYGSLPTVIPPKTTPLHRRILVSVVTSGFAIGYLD